MKYWQRARFLPNIPLYPDREKVTASKAHLELSRRAAREGMVLLKNQNNVLPIDSFSKLALFGKGIFDYVKGGGGSGDVTVSHVRNLYDGFKMREQKVDIFEPLCDYYRAYVEQEYEKGSLPGLMAEPELPSELLEQAKCYADTAIIAISRFSGEAWDRKVVYYEGQEESEKIQSGLSEALFGESDYYLTAMERRMVKAVTGAFDKVIVVLNVGGVVDTEWFADNDKVDSVLLAWQGGMEGGLAMADILLGEESPSGRLPDTFAKKLEDYPSTANFHESPDYVEYTEEIYVGYRYFETMDGMKERVNYPFGYGLSYTTFASEVVSVEASDRTIAFEVEVTNTGDVAGKEVVELFVEAPQGKLGKAKRSLVAFGKTDCLKPGCSQGLTLTAEIYHMASYDHLGKVKKSAYVLEQGSYKFFLGSSVRDVKEVDYEWQAVEDIIWEQLSEKCVSVHDPANVLEPSEEALKASFPQVRGMNRINMDSMNERISIEDVIDGKADLDTFMEQLSDEELMHLLGGQPNVGVGDTFGIGNLPEYGIPTIMTADGPAGFRVVPDRGVCTTAWPVGTQLASTWNTELVHEIGVAGAEEVKENNICIWLTPAMCIHRNPLCGRNFEYYSEDPYLTGKMGAAMVNGIQSMKIGATPKHFCCNNKETNRRNSDSRVSERALREIYLKAFEIVVKEADPWFLMSAYNKMNGVRTSENKELLEDILRGEWGFDGVVTSDWFTFGEHYKEMLAGNDLKMGNGFPDRLKMAEDLGAISREDLLKAAKRVLELLMKLA